MTTKILVTGGAGFIGAHLVCHLVNKYPHYHIINLDALTYAANLHNLAPVAKAANYQFIYGDINNPTTVNNVLTQYRPEKIIHLAAQTHVDNSIVNPQLFGQTNVNGTVNLLTAWQKLWQQNLTDKLFLHMSTDEVFGPTPAQTTFSENTPYRPSSPYAASKAGADHFVRAFATTYNLPYIIAHSSNNFGPGQHQEKLIPTILNCLKRRTPIPLYGNGRQVRDWLYVKDCVAALDLLLHHGQIGQSYNISAENEWQNIELAQLLCELADKIAPQPTGSYNKLITLVDDRPGHDVRYALNSSKIKQLGWATTPFLPNTTAMVKHFFAA